MVLASATLFTTSPTWRISRFPSDLLNRRTTLLRTAITSPPLDARPDAVDAADGREAAMWRVSLRFFTCE
ncbi:hypothetical protein ACFWXB_09035 [Tsukamurella tyrosinosolvens]|uniref:hypothetical protein n=1 Tax=Tsukamurella tyrosinosolvens TaxID=57704 RepID=UPI001AF3B66B|nr:hypothetical protein [Tsukamurella tyrosinosolvens]QRY84239.1 hypothetical protein JVY00_20830 [Tsukamurella tyrosinosolvens]